MLLTLCGNHNIKPPFTSEGFKLKWIACWFVFFFCYQVVIKAMFTQDIAFKAIRIRGCFLVLRKLLLVSFCVVVWVLFSVFSIFCITSLVSATPRNHRIRPLFKHKNGCAAPISKVEHNS